MCQLCSKPFDALSDDELGEQVQALSATFVGLPMVVGAPMLLSPDYYLEVARHQVECGVRICTDRAIKSYVVPTDVEARTGGWKYDAAHSQTETPAERVARAVKEQREAYLAEVARRRANGDLPPEPTVKENRP